MGKKRGHNQFRELRKELGSVEYPHRQHRKVNGKKISKIKLKKLEIINKESEKEIKNLI